VGSTDPSGGEIDPPGRADPEESKSQRGRKKNRCETAGVRFTLYVVQRGERFCRKADIPSWQSGIWLLRSIASFPTS